MPSRCSKLAGDARSHEENLGPATKSNKDLLIQVRVGAEDVSGAWPRVRPGSAGEADESHATSRLRGVWSYWFPWTSLTRVLIGCVNVALAILPSDSPRLNIMYAAVTPEAIVTQNKSFLIDPPWCNLPTESGGSAVWMHGDLAGEIPSCVISKACPAANEIPC